MQTRNFWAGAILCVMPAFGHHSVAAEFDVSKMSKITGTISKVEFLNPHVTISVDVKNPDGTVTEWKVDAASPNVFVHNGVRRDQLVIGSTIVIEGYLAKDGSARADGRTLILADGKQLQFGPWEHDMWNPLRDPTWTACDQATPRPDNCIHVQAPAK